jgi:hypothetical protein
MRDAASTAAVPVSDAPSSSVYDRALDRLLAAWPEEAEALCRVAVAAAGGDFRPHVLSAAISAARGCKPDGRAAMEAAFACAHREAARGLLLDIAVRLHHGLRLAAARAVYDLYNEIWPNRHEVLRLYAVLLHQLGANDAALTLLDRVKGGSDPLPAANRAVIDAFVKGENRTRLPLLKPDPIPRGTGRLFIVDPGCVNAAGHHFELNLACGEIGRGQGKSCYSFIYDGAPVAVQERLTGAAALRAAVYVGTDDPNLSLAYFGQNVTMYDDLSAHLRLPFAADDTVLFHTVTNAHLSGMLRWYGELPEPRPRLSIVLRFPPETMVHPMHWPLSEYLYGHVLGLWRDAAYPRVRFFADHAGMARRFADLAGMPVETCAVPIRFPEPFEAGRAPGDDPPTLVFLGNALSVKGFHLLPGVAARVRAAIPDVRFIVQTLHADPQVLARLAAALPGAALGINQPLHGDAYHQLIRLADAVWAVYDPETYRYRTSHTMVEALGFGRPAVVTTGTTMAEDLAETGGAGAVTVDRFDEEAAAAGVIDALTRRVELGRQARAVAPIWRARHGFETFFRRMTTDD